MSNLSDANAGITIVPSPQSPAAVGSLAEFTSGTAPSGWLEANGAAVSRTTYSELFAAIGTTYGVGDGSTTFNLPTEASAYDPVNMIVAVKAYGDTSGVSIGLSNATIGGTAITDTLQADSIVDTAGTGSPDFANGLTAAKLATIALKLTVQNNATETSISSNLATIYRYNTTGGAVDITSISGAESGKIILINKVAGAGDLTVNTSLLGFSQTVATGETLFLWYDATSLLWRKIKTI